MQRTMPVNKASRSAPGAVVTSSRQCEFAESTGRAPSLLDADWSDDITIEDDIAFARRMRRRTKLIRDIWYGALVCVVFLLVTDSKLTKENLVEYAVLTADMLLAKLAETEASE